MSKLIKTVRRMKRSISIQFYLILIIALLQALAFFHFKHEIYMTDQYAYQMAEVVKILVLKETGGSDLNAF